MTSNFNLSQLDKMNIDFDKIEQELDRVKNLNTNQTKTWKPEKGITKIRALPYIHNLKFPFIIEKFHYNLKGKSWCLENEGEKCPVCEKVIELFRSAKENDDAYKRSIAKELMANTRYFMPIVVVGKEDEGVKIWGFSKTVYEDLLSFLKKQNGKMINVKDGFCLIVTYTPPPAKAGKKQYGKIKVEIDFDTVIESKPLAATNEEIEAILNTTPNVEKDCFPKATKEELIAAYNEFIDTFDSKDETESEDGEEGSEEAEKTEVAETEEETEAVPTKPTPKTASKPAKKNDDLIDLDSIEDEFKDIINRMEK